MPIVELYTSPFCGYCIVAKRLLVDRNLNYVEVDLSNEPNRRSEMLLRSGGSHTVPQIFINNKHVGKIEHMETGNMQKWNMLEKLENNWKHIIFWKKKNGTLKTVKPDEFLD